jgi:hypothetical protein
MVGTGRSDRVAALGFTVKSGWASAVLVVGTPASPMVVESRRIELSDPSVPESRQPYHAGFGTARKSGLRLTALVGSVKRFGRKSVSDLIKAYHGEGYRLRRAGIVVGSLVDPGTIGNDHIRIHALEGQLFRRVVEDGTTRARVSPSIWRERDLFGAAAVALERPEQELRDRVTALGKSIDGSWRAEQKAATLAAWLVLADL